MTGATEAGRGPVTWTPTQYARNGAVEIAYDTLAGSEGEPAAACHGPGRLPRFWWPAGLCQAFAGRGFAVARYDQRDAGQSTRMPDAGGSNPFVALARKRGAYTSEDMTDDAVAVLDALGWKQAHIVGASLGGIIAQRIALRHPDRVLSVVSVGRPAQRRVWIWPRAGTCGSACWPGSRGPGSPRAGRATCSSRSCSPARWPPRPTRSTSTPRESGSSARSTAAPATPGRRAGRSARRGMGRSCASCASPSSSCTATRIPSFASAPPMPPPRRSREPAC